ncbi:hypothetical protein ARMSODRAFT_1062717 [Armillaria solidipes]|uniref:Uncharacterized protein n=1 Tax=Armillaria solidipes TaxID=1076256 RepID=A0A2H3BD06_9AGAR|nr:hypothetical protein ARMSODRAFT_1062717 [Armillaria solidipes]
MFTSLITLSLVLSGFASPYKRATSLSVSLSGPATNVTSIDDLKFTVTRDGETRSLGSRWVVYVSFISGHRFTSFLQLTVSLEDIDDSAFAIIPPGQSITVNHELSTLFDFASASPGTFTSMPVTSFQTARRTLFSPIFVLDRQRWINAYRLSCTDTFRAFSSGVIAYTVISTNVCIFLYAWPVPYTKLCRGTSVASRNVRSGTILHE